MPNRLAHETSPYLLQHKDNPVDWYPWGEEAFERAKAEDRPIFLSVGYSACHWCHVMEHESFEDEETAAIMNEHFVSIKVDREERPDVDSIYMNAVQALTGRGGWPMSVWLLPDGRPFYGGTYFPNTPRQGIPSFKQVLVRVAEVFQEKRANIESDAMRLTEAVSGRVLLESEHSRAPSASMLHVAYEHIAQRYDRQWGGLGTQPKFPPSMTLELLLRLHRRFRWSEALDMVTHTLDRMARGGIYDQLGGGFHRYSVDHRWLVPHFEKMLYDNALLIRAYLYGYQVTGAPLYRQVVEETVAYVEREMTDPQGGFYSSQDADSEGEEGRYFVWTEQELRAALGSAVQADAVLDYWGVLHGSNFEGKSILWVPDEPERVALRHQLTPDALMAEVARAREVLLAHRERRVRPGRDDKILAAWNGLMISSLAQAGRALGSPVMVEMASRAAGFVLSRMQAGGRLLRSWRDGQARIAGYLEDYALMAEGLIELYQATFDLRWYESAANLTETMVELFWDDASGFYDTAHDHEKMITRPQEVSDNATPSGMAAAVGVLARMAILAGRPDWREKADRVLARLGPAVEQYASAFAYLASQMDFVLGEPHEIALAGEPGSGDLQALLNVLWGAFRPNQVVALRADDADPAYDRLPLLGGRTRVDGQAAAYVCRRYVCQLPVTSPEGLRQLLDDKAS
jgi:hypothetical protein